MRDALGTGIYFMTYESSKQLLTTFGGDGAHSNPLAVLVAGGLCGIVSWAMICEYLLASGLIRSRTDLLWQTQLTLQRASINATV